MSRQVTSQALGQLIQDENFNDWWNIDKVQVPFFSNAEFTVTFMDFDPDTDSTFITEADEALEAFLKKGDSERLEISDLVFKNFQTIKNEIDYPYWSDELKQVSKPIDIWKFVRPLGITVTRRPYGEQDIFIDITCYCAWEEEHGLQLVFRQGKKLTRVSQVDGHLTDADAYDIPDDQDELLSKF